MRPLTSELDAQGFPKVGPLDDDIIESFDGDFDSAPGLTTEVVTAPSAAQETPVVATSAETVPDTPSTLPTPATSVSSPASPLDNTVFDDGPPSVPPAPFFDPMFDPTIPAPPIPADLRGLDVMTEEEAAGATAVPELMTLDQMRTAMRTPTYLWKVDEAKILCSTCCRAIEKWVVFPAQSTTKLFFCHSVVCTAIKNRPFNVNAPVYACSKYKPGRDPEKKPAD